MLASACAVFPVSPLTSHCTDQPAVQCTPLYTNVHTPHSYRLMCAADADTSHPKVKLENSGSVGARARLSEYYGLEASRQPPVKEPLKSAMKKISPGRTQNNPYDINSPDFDSDLYVTRLRSEASLAQLMAQEGEVVKQIQGLDSDMQTLVYENYNKFISATETIRKMRVDFRSMESEMEQLASSMTTITTFSCEISDKLRGGRQEVARLSGAHSTLQKLQFVLELPEKLQESVEEGRHAQAVQDWLQAERALKHYRNMPSFAGIQEDCDRIMEELKLELSGRFTERDCDAEKLGEAVDLLRQLGWPGEDLCDRYLQHCSVALLSHLDSLQAQTDLMTGKLDSRELVIMDTLQFVDEGCNNFLAELSLAATGYNNTFNSPATGVLEPQAGHKLTEWLEKLMEKYLHVMQERLSLEQNLEDCSLLVRSLDRFYRRLTVTNKLIPGLDIIKAGLDVVLAVAQQFSLSARRQLELKFADKVMDARQTIAQPRKGSDQALNLQEVGTRLLTGITENLKSVLATLQSFLDPELCFSAKTYFTSRFCTGIIQDQILLHHLNNHVVEECRKLGSTRTVSPAVMLVLARTCLDLHTNTTNHMAGLVAEQFHLLEVPCMSEVNSSLSEVSQFLLDGYVKAEAADLSLMIRKSVEARDWLSTVEPRSVRAVMKRVIEDVTVIDQQVGQLYEEGHRKVRSSDSSRTFGHRSRSVLSGNNTSSNLDSSLASNIQKLFSEKIDYFAPVTSTKVRTSKTSAAKFITIDIFRSQS